MHLTRQLTLDLVQTFIEPLPLRRREEIRFKNNRPGCSRLAGFILRHPSFTTQTSVDLERDRGRAMSPENVASYIARLRWIMDKNDIADQTHVFIMDQCGFAVSRVTRGKLMNRVVEKCSHLLAFFKLEGFDLTYN